MNEPDTVAAIFADHQSAEAAVKKLADIGLTLNNLTIMGKGFYTEDKVVGDWIKVWRKLGEVLDSVWRSFFGGLSVLGTALYGVGVPRESVNQYEAALKADSFMVMAHGTVDEISRAKVILGAASPTRLDDYAQLKTPHREGVGSHAEI